MWLAFHLKKRRDHGQAESLTEKPVDNSQYFSIIYSYFLCLFFKTTTSSAPTFSPYCLDILEREAPWANFRTRDSLGRVHEIWTSSSCQSKSPTTSASSALVPTPTVQIPNAPPRFLPHAYQTLSGLVNASFQAPLVSFWPPSKASIFFHCVVRQGLHSPQARAARRSHASFAFSAIFPQGTWLCDRSPVPCMAPDSFAAPRRDRLNFQTKGSRCDDSGAVTAAAAETCPALGRKSKRGAGMAGPSQHQRGFGDGCGLACCLPERFNGNTTKYRSPKWSDREVEDTEEIAMQMWFMLIHHYCRLCLWKTT